MHLLLLNHYKDSIMTILITGSTGHIGTQLIQRLSAQGAAVRALVRDPAKASFGPGVLPVQGDLTDVDSMRAALAGVRTLFLLNAVTPDELTQALSAVSLAQEAGVRNVVYLSVQNSDRYTTVPHFAAKHVVERALADLDMAATILRPSYFMQNDLQLKDALLGYGVYPMPIGSVGISMVDTADIAEVAAMELLRRDGAAGPLPGVTIDLVGPEVLTGPGLAALWSELLGKTIHYGGDDLHAFEQQTRAYMPHWAAYDMALMAGRFQRDGMVAATGAVETLTALLGRAPRSYRQLAGQALAQWRAGAPA